MIPVDEQAKALIERDPIWSDDDKAEILLALDEGEIELITDGDQVVGLMFPIIDQDPGDEDG